jgi:hypothetical protein
MLLPHDAHSRDGGAGFLGSHITERLLAEGNAIVHNLSAGRTVCVTTCAQPISVVLTVENTGGELSAQLAVPARVGGSASP